MGNIKYREVRYSDIPQLASLHAAAFWDDGLVGEWMNPRRNAYPKDFYHHFLRRYRINYWEYHRNWLVAVDQDENGKDIIVGSAQWERMGEGRKKMLLWWFDPRNLMKPLYSAWMRFDDLIWPNRATVDDRENVFERAYPFINPIWSGKRKESWYLEILAVHPDYQGKGIGRQLVKWGLDKAEKEDISASVISASGKDGFYLKVGFEERFGSSSMGDGNPLKGTEGGNMYWKLPEALKDVSN